MKKEINSLTQKQQSVGDYFIQLKAYWNELANYRQLSQCSCETLKTFSEFQQEKCVTIFNRVERLFYQQIELMYRLFETETRMQKFEFNAFSIIQCFISSPANSIKRVDQKVCSAIWHQRHNR